MQKEEADYLQIWTRQLLNEHRSICYQYGIALKQPIIELTNAAGYWGKWLAAAGTISLSRALLLDHSWDVVLNVLKHEMAHQLVTEELGGKPGHNADFKRACARLGVPAFYRKASGPALEANRQGDPDAPPGIANRKLEKIRKLLALSDSANEHESLQAMRKARQLLDKYNLADELGGEESGPSFTNLLINLKRTRLESYHRAICSLLIDHFNIQLVITPLFDARALTSYKCLDIMGRSDNVEIAGYVYHFLMDRLPLMWQNMQATGRAPKTGRNSYWLGILNGFREGLTADRSSREKNAPRQGQGNKLPAVAAEPALQRFVTGRYPKLRNSRKRAAKVDPDSYEAGRREGRRLKLRKGLNKGAGRKMLPGPT
jgi:hypothetical protein